jgi:hypothetical protein
MRIRMLVQLCGFSVLFSSCAPGQLLGPTYTPIPTNTQTHTFTQSPTTTNTPTLMPTITSTITPSATALPCKGVPIMDGAEEINIDTDVCSYIINTSTAKVVEYYMQVMPVLGFTLIDTENAGGGKILFYQKENEEVVINIFVDFIRSGYALVIIPVDPK